MLSKFKKILIFVLFSSAVITAQSKTVISLERTEKKLPFGLTDRIPVHFPKVGLALSGGGARSISQIGVLKAFEEEKIPLDMILGTSMGSIVGGLYSAGYSISQLDSVLRDTDWPSFFSPKQSGRTELFIDQKITEDRAVVSFRLDGFNPILPTSVSSGQRAANYLNLLALNAPLQNKSNFDDLIYKFRAISTDLISGQKIIIQNGSLGTAMRASSSITLLLPPVKIDSMMLVDGGLVSNLPARETRKLGADIVIAVNSSSPLYSQPELNKPWIIADQLVSIPMKILNEQQIEEADFVVTPLLNGTKNIDFTNHNFLIEEGYKAAKPIAAEIKKEIEGMFRRNLNYDAGYFKNIFLRKDASPIDVKLFNSIQNTDSVSIRDLRFEIYRMLQSDQWKDLQIVIDHVNDSSFISVIAESNPLINQIIVEGVALLDLSEIDTLLASKNYRYYNSKTALNVALEILRLYRKNGYPLTHIKEITFNELNNTLLIGINEGIICEIKVTGNTRTNQKLITRELPMSVGEFFQYKYAETGLTNLRSTNLFDNIELITNTKNDSISILIDVDERISRVIRLGFRIDNENMNQLSFDIRDENFRGTGTEIGATFAGGLRNRFISIEQKSNRVFDSYLTYKIRAFHEFNDVNVYQEVNTNNEKSFRRNKTGEYRQIFYGGSFGIGSQVGRFGNAFMEARYQRDEIKNKLDFTGDTYKVDISTLRFSIAVDSQNDYPYPTSGFFVNAFYETAQTILGGDIGYTKLFFDYKSIFSYEEIHVWSLRTMIGFADQTLPLSQQFSLGGQNLFFGLRDNELRGRQIALASLEYRYKLPFKVFFDTYVRMRYDLGSIWSEREAIRFKDLLHGIGTTLSIKTPIGPADFSVGRSFLFKNTLTKNIISRGEIFFYFTIGYYY